MKRNSRRGKTQKPAPEQHGKGTESAFMDDIKRKKVQKY